MWVKIIDFTIQQWKRRWVRLATWAILVIAGAYLVDLWVRIAIHKAGLDALGAWWGRFLISPAVGGLAALVAAIIGASMLWKQLQHTKEKDFDSAWWEKFEWTTDRAYPSVEAEQAIPHGLATTILQTLADTATDDLQKLACGGFMDHLYELEQNGQKSPNSNTADSGRLTIVKDESASTEALSSYVEATRFTPARSVVAEAHLYERQVVQALGEIEDVTLLAAPASGRDYGYDARILFDGCLIAVEVKYWDSSSTSSGAVAARIRHTLKRLDGVEEKLPILMVVPDHPKVDVSKFSSIVEFAAWTPGSGSETLELALKKLARRQPS